jgi:hypothetical protein
MTSVTSVGCMQIGASHNVGCFAAHNCDDVLIKMTYVMHVRQQCSNPARFFNSGVIEAELKAVRTVAVDNERLYSSHRNGATSSTTLFN